MFKGKIIKLVKMDFRNDRMWEIIAAYLCGEEVEAADMERFCSGRFPFFPFQSGRKRNDHMEDGGQLHRGVTVCIDEV